MKPRKPRPQSPLLFNLFATLTCLAATAVVLLDVLVWRP